MGDRRWPAAHAKAPKGANLGLVYDVLYRAAGLATLLEVNAGYERMASRGRRQAPWHKRRNPVGVG